MSAQPKKAGGSPTNLQKGTSMIPGGPAAGTPRVVLITGASSGFGKALALKLLKKGGLEVYCTARRTQQMEDLRQEGGKILAVDVTSEKSIQFAIDEIMASSKRIDVLVANAGYGVYGMTEACSMDQVKEMFEVNVFGVGRCLKAVLPIMRNQKHGRVVLVSSVMGRASALGMGWYAASKHCMSAMAVALRQEVRDFGIDVALIEPGVVKTGFDQRAFAEMAETSAIEDYAPLQATFTKTMKDFYAKAPDADSTATAMKEACCDKKPKHVYKTTQDSSLISFLQAWTPDAMYDSLVMNQIFRKTAAKVDKKEKKTSVSSVKDQESEQDQVPLEASSDFTSKESHDLEDTEADTTRESTEE
eukprot:Selendium_serpulae@DN5447_c0_g1_i1.p1